MLTTRRDQMQAQFPSKNKGTLQLELDEQQAEFTNINKRIAEIKNGLIRDEAMFGESKAFIERK